MFGFMKKHSADREEKEKKKREKKDEKKKKKSIEKGLTPEELRRLEEAKRGLFHRGGDAGGAKPYPHDVNTSDSNDSLNDPGGTNYTSATKMEISRTVKVPPPTHPKPKKGILKGKSNYGPEIPNQGVRGNVDDCMILEENTLANEILPGEMAKPDGDPEQKAKVVKSMIKTRPTDAPPMRPMAARSGSLTKSRSSSQQSQQSGAGDMNADVDESQELAGELSAEPLSPTTPVSTEKMFSDVDLQLPNLAPPRCPNPREIVLKRQPAGDFGFSLRRGTVLERGRDDTSGSEKKRQVIFAEPGPKNTQTRLLPGDRLVEVNGQNVESSTREEIIELIKRAKSSVKLVVQPIPELSELSLRSGLDGEDVMIEEQSMKTGTLQRSGSMRFKSRTAKSEAEVASEREFLSGEQIWLVHKGGFASARKLEDQVQDEGRCKVKLDHAGEELEVDEDDVERANPPQYDRVEDLASLRYINESSLLHTLRQRYGSNLVHSYGGQSLLVLNPMHPLSIYSEKVIQMFRGCKPEDMPPHVYAVAQTAYRTMLSSRQHQSLVFLGRSGSGKTTCTRHILHFFTVAAGSVNNTLSVEKLNAIFTLLDAFGNSRTIMNTSATRFTHIFSLDFDHTGQIAAASIQVLMLDKMRVVKRPEGEPTFHVFYQMLAGIDTHLRKELQLENLNEPNLFMTPLQRAEDRQRATQAWGKIHHALSTLNIKEEEMKALYLILAAIYHLGIAGTMKGPNNKYQFARPAAAQRAANALGTTVEELSRTIFSSSQGGGTPKRTGSFAGSVQAEKSTETFTGLECLEGFVVGLYAEVFNALVTLMNRCLSSGHRTVSSLLILDNPGVQNPSTCGRQAGARFEDLCHNYMQERLQLLFHELVFTSQQDLYAQENIDCDFEPVSSSPAPMVALLDQNVQQTLVRQGGGERNNMERKGLFWLLDEEAIYPGATEDTFLQRLLNQYQNPKQGKAAVLLKRGKAPHTFTLNHYQGTNPVTYNVKGWLRTSRENPVAWSVNTFLQESSRQELSTLFTTMRSSMGGLTLAPGDSSSLRRVSSLRRGAAAGTAGMKRKSVCLQVKFQVDSVVETLRKTRVYFVHCLLPQHNGGLCDLRMALGQTKPNTYEDFAMNVPLVRSQIRGNEVLEAIRIHRQGFPDHILFDEFRRRFNVLVPQDLKSVTALGDDKMAVQKILEQLDVDKATYRLGLSQVFFRTGGLAKLEEAREEKISGFIVQLQSQCRGYLGRQRLQKLKVQHLAVRCIQRNVRKYLAVRDWSWWRLYNKIQPILNVQGTEDLLRNRELELEQLKMKFSKLEKERNELKQEVDNLSARLAETTADLSEIHTTSSHASELLESEQADRMRMEKEIRELQSKFQMQQRKLEMTEMDLMQAQVYSTQYDSEAEDEVDGQDSIYRERYEKIKREIHFTKQKLTQQHEEEVEQFEATKKAHDRKLTEALEDAEEQRHQVQNLKRKLQRLTQEMMDLKLHLEEQYSRNTELEKKQRKFDGDLHKIGDEMRQEKVQKEKLQRERDQLAADKYTIDQDLKNLNIDYELGQEKIQRLNKELTELSSTDNKDDKELLHLKRLRNELEQKLQEQEEELDDQAGTIQQLEQGKLRLEMAQEKLRQQHAKEVEEKDTETEEMRATAQKKLRTLESQIEEEYAEKQAAVKEKRELERKLQALNEQTPTRDRDAERRLRRDLKKTKALLHDAHMMLEKQKDAGSKTTIKQLRNQLEDAECATAAAVKARKGIEVEVQELQQQLDSVAKNKQETEARLMGLVRDNTDYQSRVEEHDEELDEIMRKYKAAVQQLTVDKKQIQDQSQEVEEIQHQKQELQEQVIGLQSKVDYMENNTVDKQSMVRLEAKVRDLETRLELEQTTRTRVEGHLSRLKEQQERLEEEKDRSVSTEKRQHDEVRKLQHSLRDTRDQLGDVQGREAEASQRKRDLEQRLESIQSDYEQSQSDLRLAFKRINDLQAVIEDQINSDFDDDDEDDSDLANSDGSSLGSDSDYDDLDEPLVNHQPRVLHLSGDSADGDRFSEGANSSRSSRASSIQQPLAGRATSLHNGTVSHPSPNTLRKVYAQGEFL